MIYVVKLKGILLNNRPFNQPLSSNGKKSVLLINFISGNNNYTGMVLDGSVLVLNLDGRGQCRELEDILVNQGIHDISSIAY